jgi:hypothetical protein
MMNLGPDSAAASFAPGAASVEAWAQACDWITDDVASCVDFDRSGDVYLWPPVRETPSVTPEAAQD